MTVAVANYEISLSVVAFMLSVTTWGAQNLIATGRLPMKWSIWYESLQPHAEAKGLSDEQYEKTTRPGVDCCEATRCRCDAELRNIPPGMISFPQVQRQLRFS
jgi:hypothetical protein